jgi:hypothetical protein
MESAKTTKELKEDPHDDKANKHLIYSDVHVP